MNIEKEQRAISYLKTFEPESEPYYLCYSGGKDSDCIRILAELAGVKHECKHNLTTVDAPETVRYVRETIGRENINRPEKSMWKLIEEVMFPPARKMRYCCEKLKEHGGNGRLKITGVRWAESKNRKDNGGFVKIIGKPKTMQKEAESQNVNFRSTKRGGGSEQRQRRIEEICRTLLQNHIDYGKSDSRLDRFGCVGISALLWVPE